MGGGLRTAPKFRKFILHQELFMKINFFNQDDRKKPYTSYTVDPGEFIDGFAQEAHEITEDENSVDLLCFTDFGAGNTRCAENAETVEALVCYLEDSHLKLDSLVDKLDSTGVSFVLYSGHTHSEQELSAVVIVPLEQAVDASTFVEEAMVSRFAQMADIHVDESSFSLIQAYPEPCCPAEYVDLAKIVAHNTGRFLTIEDLPEKIKGKSKKPIESDKKTEKNSPAKIAQAIYLHFFKKQMINFQEQYFHYQSGHWQVISKKMLLKQLCNKFESEFELADLQKGLGELSIRQYEDDFPVNTQLATAIKSELSSVRLIGLKNADVDPLTGIAYPHTPENYVRNQLPFSFDANATCPVWTEFLQQSWKADADLDQKVALLQEWIGYLMISDCRFQKMLWLVGPGGTGKSTCLKVIELLLGPSNVSAVKLNKLSDRFALAGMLNKLVNISPEVQSHARISDDTIKSIVSGDPVMIEYKGKDAFPAQLSTRIMAAANILPKVSDDTNAFYRRLMILEFLHIVAEEDQDPYLVEKLKTELSGIFNWALVGLQRLLTQNSFTIPTSSKRSVKNFEHDSDVVKKFIAEHCVASETERTLVADVYQTFRDYCKRTGNPSCNDSEFGRRMSQAGFKAKKSKSRYYMLELINI